MRTNPDNHGDCMADEMLTDYLDGSLDPVVRAAGEGHLIACDKCRLRLAFFMRLLKEDVTAGEQTLIESIEHSWRKAEDNRLRRSGVFRRWMLSIGAMVAALIIVVAGLRMNFDRFGEPRSANEVLNLLLAQNRPFEGRISGQAHLPFVSTRGPETPEPNFSLLAGEMSRLSATPWQMGQFYLLQRDFNRAIEYLQPAARDEFHDPRVHNDLGVAYMEKGGPDNLRKAVEEFSQALWEKSGFASAAFNLAVAYDRLNDVANEERELEQYLQLETDPAWANEARAKLEGLKR